RALSGWRDEDVVTFNQHIAEMDADAPFHSAFGGDCGVPLRRQALQCQGAFDNADSEANSIKMPSPVVLTTRPPCSVISGSAATRCSRTACAVPASSSPISRL